MPPPSWAALPQGAEALVDALMAAPARTRDALFVAAEAHELQRLVDAATAVAPSPGVAGDAEARAKATDAQARADKARLLVADAVRMGAKAQLGARRDQVLGQLVAAAPVLAWRVAAALPRKLAEDLAQGTVTALLAVPPARPDEAERKLAEAWLRRASGDPSTAAALVGGAEAGLRVLVRLDSLQCAIGRTLAAAGAAAPDTLTDLWVQASVASQAEAVLPVLDNLSLEHPVFTRALMTHVELRQTLPARNVVRIGELLARKANVKRGVAPAHRTLALKILVGLACTQEVLWQQFPWHTPHPWPLLAELGVNERTAALRGMVVRLSKGAAASERAATLTMAASHVTPDVALQVGAWLFASAPSDVALARALAASIEALGRWLDPQQGRPLDVLSTLATLEAVTLSLDVTAADDAQESAPQSAPPQTARREAAGAVYAALDAQAFFLPQLLHAEHYVEAAQIVILAHLDAPQSLVDLRSRLLEVAGAYPCMALVNAVQKRIGQPWAKVLVSPDVEVGALETVGRRLRRAEPKLDVFCAKMLTHLAYLWAYDPKRVMGYPHSDKLVKSEVLPHLLGSRQQLCAWQPQEVPVQRMVEGLAADPICRSAFVAQLLRTLDDEEAPLAHHRSVLPGVLAALHASPAGAQRRQLAERFDAAVRAAGARALRGIARDATRRSTALAGAVARARGSRAGGAPSGPRLAQPSAALAQAPDGATLRRSEQRARQLLIQASEILQPALLDVSDIDDPAKAAQTRRARQLDALKYAQLVPEETPVRATDAILRHYAAPGAHAAEVVETARIACQLSTRRCFAEEDAGAALTHLYNWLVVAYTVQAREPTLRSLAPAVVDAVADAARGQADGAALLSLLYALLHGEANAPSSAFGSEDDVALLGAMRERLLQRAVADNVDLAGVGANLNVPHALRDTAAVNDFRLRLTSLLRHDEAGRDREIAALCGAWPALSRVFDVAKHPIVDAFDYALIDGNLRMETLRSLARHGANSAAFNAEMVRRLAQACPIDQEEREVLRDVAGAEAFLAAARA